jgi:hypothetical protein
MPQGGLLSRDHGLSQPEIVSMVDCMALERAMVGCDGMA